MKLEIRTIGGWAISTDSKDVEVIKDGRNFIGGSIKTSDDIINYLRSDNILNIKLNEPNDPEERLYIPKNAIAGIVIY